MFFRRTNTPAAHTSSLDRVVEAALPNSDPDTRKIVTAVAALLGSVAYADRQFNPAEQRLVHDLLQSISGIGQSGADAICAALEANVVLLSSVETPRHARALKDLADRDLRMHVLELLVLVAAADHALSHSEVVLLRQLTTSLGLEQADYNELQKQHRHLLSTLK
jgi:uncharacterized tellurite resistance protein B-like protein